MKRPWNIINCPVYSLATYVDGRVNMNICTYVTAVSLKPKLYAVALDKNTLTYERMEKTEIAVLQLLRKPHIPLVRLLGKQSGRKVEKYERLQKKDWLEQWRDFDVLKESAAYLLLEKQAQLTTGDHELFTFSLKHYRSQFVTDILMFQDLIEAKIIL